MNGLIIEVYVRSEHLICSVKYSLLGSTDYEITIYKIQNIFILVYAWFNFLITWIFHVSFSSRYTPRYFVDWSLLFHNMGWLLIFNCVGLKYFLKVNIFVFLLIRFKVSYKLREFSDNQLFPYLPSRLYLVF